MAHFLQLCVHLLIVENMENKLTLHSSKIRNLITRFYYKENHLCFQILLSYDNDQTILYREYNDYARYKTEYNNLLEAKASNEFVLVQEGMGRETHLSFM